MSTWCGAEFKLAIMAKGGGCEEPVEVHDADAGREASRA